MEDYGALAKEYLGQLIAFDTSNEPGNEQPLAEHIAAVLTEEGFRTEVQTVAPSRANCVARYGDSPNKILFNGHLDVVPRGEGWSREAFRMTEEGGRLYGRGSCDMKGGLAAQMAAAVKLAREGNITDCELILIFSADEELHVMGSNYFAPRFEKGKRNWVVIGEPTECGIQIAHRGAARLRVELFGRQCHAGKPQLGINALTLAGEFTVAVDRLNREKQRIKHKILPPPTIAVTGLQGGVKDNVIPGGCQIVLDYRPIPGESAETLTREIEGLLRELFGGREGVHWKIEPYIDVLPAITEPGALIVKTAEKATAAVFGAPSVVDYFPACCDMSCFTANGFEVILCGPGSLNQAHTADEYVEEEQLRKMVEVYEAFVLCARDAREDD